MNKQISTGAGIAAVVLFATIVCAIVWFAQGNQAKPQTTMPTPKIPAQQQMQSQKNEQSINQNANQQTAGWKTYTNSQFGFEIKYPPIWKISTERSDASSVVWDIPGGEGTENREAVNFEVNSKKITLNQAKSEIVDQSVITKESQVSVAGEKALKVETSEFAITHIIFLHSGNIYDIETQGGISNEMLATFEFLK